MISIVEDPLYSVVKIKTLFVIVSAMPCRKYRISNNGHRSTNRYNDEIFSIIMLSCSVIGIEGPFIALMEWLYRKREPNVFHTQEPRDIWRHKWRQSYDSFHTVYGQVKEPGARVCEEFIFIHHLKWFYFTFSKWMCCNPVVFYKS